MRGSINRQIKQTIPSIVIMIAMIVVAAQSSDKFLGSYNLANIMFQSSTLAVVAIAQSLVLFIGGIDMSVGSVISLGTIIMAMLSASSGIGLVGAVVLVIIVGGLVGVINGVGVEYFHIPAMIITISTQVFIKGICLILMPSSGGKVNEDFVKFMKIKHGVMSNTFIFVLFMYCIFFLIMHYTVFGRKIYAVGNNVVYATQSGIHTRMMSIKVYILAGIVAGIAGIVLSTRISVGNALVGDTYSMDSVTAAVVGGISMNGGVGTVLGALIGSIVLSLINNVMNNMDISPYYQYIIKGLLLMISLMLFQLKRRKNS